MIRGPCDYCKQRKTLYKQPCDPEQPAAPPSMLCNECAEESLAMQALEGEGELEEEEL